MCFLMGRSTVWNPDTDAKVFDFTLNSQHSDSQYDSTQTMPMQLDLLEPPPSPRPVNRLFLAIFPDADAVQQISERAPGMQSSHRLTGTLRPRHHFHITVHWFDDYAEIPGDVVQAAGEACEAVTSLTPAFEVSFDRVMSFRGRPGNCPFVLTGNDHPDTDLMKFHAMLSKQLLKHRCPGRARSHFKPHLTLLYDRQIVQETSIKPVAWTAGEIVLIHSELGATRYHRLGSWKFRG